MTITFWVLAFAAVAVAAATVLSAVAAAPPAAPVSAPAPSVEPTPRETVSPSPTPTPTATPTQAPTPTPTPQPAEPWVFKGAWLEIPCVGISGPITEYTPAMLVEGDVDPAEMNTIAWYSGTPGGILSRDATNTNYVYGHSWVTDAIFNGVRRMTPGCQAIITTENGETLTYLMAEERFTVPKPELKFHPRVTKAEAGRLVLVSCYRPDDYDPNAATKDNVVAVLQLVEEPESASASPSGEAMLDPQRERVNASRLG